MIGQIIFQDIPRGWVAFCARHMLLVQSLRYPFIRFQVCTVSLDVKFVSGVVDWAVRLVCVDLGTCSFKTCQVYDWRFGARHLFVPSLRYPYIRFLLCRSSMRPKFVRSYRLGSATGMCGWLYTLARMESKKKVNWVSPWCLTNCFFLRVRFPPPRA